ncbi:MAG: hypothetical protein NTY89_18550 [Nostocales cyanobacterium LacPavin_0920_SED1_MAG_38_18]|nr:hypothetical protein [Dolichospermum sp. BR01]MCX5983748.1 hypothetical protein [Nostocales cyanobacterium LacPavin_0920_SED1_MAG_38_18]
MKKLDEIRHLNTLPEPTERPKGLGIVRFIVQCPNNAEMVLNHAKEVLEAVLKQMPDETLDNDIWNISLPNWFIDACAPEKSQEEAEQWLKWWRSLPPQEQEKASKDVKWSLEDWIYWIKPNMRQWFWWDAIIDDACTIRIAVEVEAYPFAWGSLEWLFKASGANIVQAEE